MIIEKRGRRERSVAFSPWAALAPLPGTPHVPGRAREVAAALAEVPDPDLGPAGRVLGDRHPVALGRVVDDHLFHLQVQAQIAVDREVELGHQGTLGLEPGQDQVVAAVLGGQDEVAVGIARGLVDHLEGLGIQEHDLGPFHDLGAVDERTVDVEEVVLVGAAEHEHQRTHQEHAHHIEPPHENLLVGLSGVWHQPEEQPSDRKLLKEQIQGK